MPSCGDVDTDSMRMSTSRSRSGSYSAAARFRRRLRCRWFVGSPWGSSSASLRRPAKSKGSRYAWPPSAHSRAALRSSSCACMIHPGRCGRYNSRFSTMAQKAETRSMSARPPRAKPTRVSFAASVSYVASWFATCRATTAVAAERAIMRAFSRVCMITAEAMMPPMTMPVTWYATRSSVEPRYGSGTVASDVPSALFGLRPLIAWFVIAVAYTAAQRTMCSSTRGVRQSIAITKR
mmetsp:Transcript_54386/g.167394  ORF Transcript_54386/g.167394 Transcript_54386/m.167394 type:complete len:236 (-) Transcript_54386:297-1004(-)